MRHFGPFTRLRLESTVNFRWGDKTFNAQHSTPNVEERMPCREHSVFLNQDAALEKLKSANGFCVVPTELVPTTGLEPVRCYSLEPESSASANSATWASREITMRKPPRPGKPNPLTDYVSMRAFLPTSSRSDHPRGNDSVRRRSRRDVAKTTARYVRDLFAGCASSPMPRAGKIEIVLRSSVVAVLSISISTRTKTSASASGLGIRARSRFRRDGNLSATISPLVLHAPLAPRSRKVILLLLCAVCRRTDSTSRDSALARVRAGGFRRAR